MFSIKRYINYTRSLLRNLGIYFGLEKYKHRVNKKIYNQYQGIIRYGIFKGYQLPKQTWWGHFDIASKIFGLYEKAVLDELAASGKVDLFIDIGAADGYYALGMLHSGLADNVICYEKSVLGRKIILESATINSFTNRIEVLGEANLDSLKSLQSESKKAILLMDVEGFEYALLNKTLLQQFSNYKLIVELHPFTEELNIANANLISRCESIFNVRLIQDNIRNTNNLNDLNILSNDERALIMSEGRVNQMTWLVAEPKV